VSVLEGSPVPPDAADGPEDEPGLQSVHERGALEGDDAVPSAGPRRPEALSAEDREVLHRAHQRLRNASQALEALVATDPIRGRWAPTPAPPEALQAARADLEEAYAQLDRRHRELVDWGTPPDGSPTPGP
jgi:hypothetical protein